MPGVGTVGFDRARLEHLRHATDEAIATVSAVRLDDWHAADALASARVSQAFLAGPWRHAVVTTLAMWQLERDVAGRIGTAVTHLLDRRRAEGVSADGPSCQLRFADLSFEELLAQLLERIVADHGQNALSGDIWRRYGDDALDEIHARLLADPELLHHVADMPAVVPLLGLLIPRQDLPADVRISIAIAVTSTPAIGVLSDTVLHEHSRALASSIVSLTGERPIESISDVDLLVAVLRSGSGDPGLLGAWVDTTVDSLRARNWPADESIGLVAGLTRFAGLGTLSETQPPPSLVMPTAVLLAATTPLLAAGRIPNGDLYPTDDDHADAPRIDRHELRDLIGLVLTDSDAAATMFVGLRSALSAAFVAEHPHLEVERIDEIARIIDEAAHEQASELAAIEAARAEWIDRLIGLGRVGTIGTRLGGGPGVAAAHFVIGQVSELLASFVDVDQLPFADLRSYYEMSRRFEQLRSAVSAIDDPDLAARLAAIAGRLDDTISVEGGNSVGDIERAYLALEEAAAHLIDWELPTVTWNADR